MKAKLMVIDRITLLNLLPSEANLITLRVLRELKKKIGFSARDIELLEFKFDDKAGTTKWTSEKDLGLDLDLNEVEVDIIAKELKKLDKSEKLTEQHLHLCELFCK